MVSVLAPSSHKSRRREPTPQGCLPTSTGMHTWSTHPLSRLGVACLFIKTSSPYKAKAGLEPAMVTRLASNLWQASSLCLLCAGIAGVKKELFTFWGDVKLIWNWSENPNLHLPLVLYFQAPEVSKYICQNSLEVGLELHSTITGTGMKPGQGNLWFRQQWLYESIFVAVTKCLNK